MTQQEEPSGWAIGGVAFAGTMMVMIGFIQAFQGLAAVLEDEFFVVTADYAYAFDASTWGWVHLIAGALIALAGFYLFSGSAVSGMVAIALAVVSAITNFFFIPYYPFWGLAMVALNVFVIWAIARSGVLRT